MKYNKTSNFPKFIGSTGFITITACALIAVGAIGWFALSRNNTTNKTPSQDNSIQSYPDTDNSYNSQAEIPEVTEPATDVADDVNDVPYTDEQPTESVEEKISYVLPVEGNILKGFSDTALQYSATYGDMRLHTGIDILCDSGNDIKSVANGKVKSVTDDANFGRVITIEHSGDITVKYCGMGSVNVKEGDQISIGTVIGTLGEIPCECGDNPHIHIEVLLDGKTVSPLKTFGIE